MCKHEFGITFRASYLKGDEFHLFRISLRTRANRHQLTTSKKNSYNGKRTMPVETKRETVHDGIFISILSAHGNQFSNQWAASAWVHSMRSINSENKLNYNYSIAFYAHSSRNIHVLPCTWRISLVSQVDIHEYRSSKSSLFKNIHPKIFRWNVSPFKSRSVLCDFQCEINVRFQIVHSIGILLFMCVADWFAFFQQECCVFQSATDMTLCLILKLFLLQCQ